LRRLLVEAICCGRKVAQDQQAGDPSIILAVAPSESVLTLTGCSASRLPPSEASAVNAELERARQLLGGVDSLRHFGAWRSPEERVPEEGHEEGSDGETQLAE
jgi:hypothetical protein